MSSSINRPALRSAFALGLAAASLAACATTASEPTKAAKPRASETAAQDGGPVTDPLLRKGGAASKKAAAPAPSKAAAALPAVSQNCQGIVAHFAPAYLELFGQLQTGTYVKTGSAAEQLAFATAGQCDQPASRTALMSAAIEAVQGHSGRIGLLLPLSGPYAKQAAYVVNGMRAALSEASGNTTTFDQLVVLKDSAGGVPMRLAEFLFKDRVALVVGGFDQASAQQLVAWSSRILMPTLILNRERELTAPSKYAFTVYPDEQRLAATLADASRQRHFKRIAILRPTSGRGDKVAGYFTKAFSGGGGQIASDLTYTAGNFDSMQEVAKKLLKTGSRDREGKYREAMKKAKKDADDSGSAFNPKMVVLKPIVEVDAVFIPDDFRTVRYFAKIFRYNQVEHLPMIGNHEWRSPALIDPYDDFLSSSMFADFIGNYAKLPSAVSAPTLPSSPFFVNPASVEAVDFQLVGYRAARVAKAALNRGAPTRRQLPATLAALSGEQTGLPVSGPIFDKGRHCFWPTYIFSVSKQGLHLEHAQTSAKSASERSCTQPQDGCQQSIAPAPSPLRDAASTAH